MTLKKPYVEDPKLRAPGCCCIDLESKLNLRFNKIEVKLAKIENFLSEIHSDIKKQNSAVHDYIPQACSDEELRGICKNSPQIVAELANLEAPQLQESVRKMLQRLMTKNLAQQFSFTGMGAKRAPIKIRFQEHPAKTIIYKALEKTRFRDMRLADFDRALAQALRQVKDWGNGRSHKKRAREEEHVARESGEALSFISIFILHD